VKKKDLRNFDAMIERHITPVLDAVGVKNSTQMRQWLATLDIDADMPDADTIYAQMVKSMGADQ
jgi:hypothetical protein